LETALLRPISTLLIVLRELALTPVVILEIDLASLFYPLNRSLLSPLRVALKHRDGNKKADHHAEDMSAHVRQTASSNMTIGQYPPL